MSSIQYRQARELDIPLLARIRAAEWETQEYWTHRIAAYLAGELDPKDALKPRMCYAACEGDSILGFVAGHLTRRYSCDGEIEWINVIPEHRGTPVASELLRLLAAWFIARKAFRICVDVQPSNTAAHRFYSRHGAEDLNPHWMVWNDITAALGKSRP